MKKYAQRKIDRIKQKAASPGRQGLGLSHFSIGNAFGRTSRPDFLAALTGWNAICMDRVSVAVASSKYRVMLRRSQSEQIEAPLDHWASKLVFGKPNPFLRRLELCKLFEKWRLLNGNAFIWTPTYGGRYPVQMWVLPSNQMQIGSYDGFGISEFRMTAPDGMYYFDPREMLHSKNMEPSTDYTKSLFLGTPVINKIIDAIQADNELTRYLRTYFETDTVAPLVYITKGEMSLDEWENYKARWNDKFPKHQLYGVMTGESDIRPLNSGGLGGTTQAMPVTDIDDDMLEKIAAAYGMNAAFVKGNFNNRATAKVYTDDFYSNTVNRKAQAFAEELTQHLQQWDPAVIVEAELYSPQDEEFALKRTDFELKWGIRTRNEVLAEQGAEPFDGGDIRFIPNDVQLLSTLEQGGQPTASAAQPTPPMQDEAPDEEQEQVELSFTPHTLSKQADPFEDKAYADAYWKSYDDLTDEGATLLKRVVAQTFDKLERVVLGNVVELSASGAVTKDGIDAAVSLFDVEEWAERFSEETDPERRELLISAMKAALADIGQNWDEISSDFDEKIRAAQLSSSEKIKTAVGTVKEELQKLLQDMKDRPAKEVKDAIRTKFGQYTDSGAARIAETTANFTTNRAQKDAWEGFNVERMWLSRRDGNVRDAHAKADGQKADKNGFFYVGGEAMPHPGGGSDPKNNIRCRCYQRPRIITEEDGQ